VLAIVVSHSSYFLVSSVIMEAKLLKTSSSGAVGHK
jgi:hypothetical protein